MTAGAGAPRFAAPPVTAWFAVYGYPCGISTRSAAARALLRRLYAPFARAAAPAAPAAVFHLDPPAASGERRWWVREGDTPLHGRASLGTALQELEYEICRRVIGHRPDLMALHGATVFAAGGGAAAIITGPSGAGKTVLALALAARGYRVGGDDIAFLDPRSGQLWPLPRCFHLDAHAWRLLRHVGLRVPPQALRHRFLTPADFGADTLRTAPVRQVLLAARGPDPGPRLSPLTQAEVGLNLLPQLRWSPDASTAALAALLPLAGAVAGYRLTSGELAATVTAVAAVLGPP